MPTRPADTAEAAGSHGRAVSPAIGIALLLVIGFVIASLLGLAAATLVTGDTKAPTASIFVGSCTTPDGTTVFKLQHNAGDAMDADRLQLRYSGVGWRYVPETGPGDALTGVVEGRIELNGDQLTSGDTVLLGHTAADLDLSDATIQLVWEDGESGYVLTQWHGGGGAFRGIGSTHCPFPPGPDSNTQAYSVTIGECEWTPGADDKGHGNQCSVDEDTDNPGGGNGGGGNGGDGNGGGGN